MWQNDTLHALKGIVGESMAQDTPLPAMNCLINRIVSVMYPLGSGKRIVKVRFFEWLSESVYVMQPLGRIDGDEVGCDADVRTIFLV
jgi:hypothetical protein